MSRVHVFTSAAGNYLPKVSVLFDSIAKHQPDWHRHLLLVEDWADADCAALELEAEIRQPRDLDIPAWRHWAFCHSLVELCTAVKPFMLKQLLARDDCDAAVYLDPDVCVFSALPEVLDGLSRSSVLLTPHLTEPEVSDRLAPENELTSLRLGSFNLGFIAVADSEDGRKFAQWWADRCYEFCYDDPALGFFTDQRWIDLVPSLFSGVEILRDTRLNVASWNARQRRLTWSDGTLHADGVPVGFYHFTGFSSGNHSLMIQKYPEQRAVMEKITKSYRDALKQHERHFNVKQWSFERFASGERILDEARVSYLNDRGKRERYPDPWLAGNAELVDGRGPNDALGYGYSAVDATFDIRKFLALFLSAITRPALLPKMLSAGRRILREEGVKGIKRRLSKLEADKP